MNTVIGTGKLAALIGVSGLTIKRLAREGVIPSKRLPGKRRHFRYAESDVPKIKAILIAGGLIDDAGTDGNRAKRDATSAPALANASAI